MPTRRGVVGPCPQKFQRSFNIPTLIDETDFQWGQRGPVDIG